MLAVTEVDSRLIATKPLSPRENAMALPPLCQRPARAVPATARRKPVMARITGSRCSQTHSPMLTVSKVAPQRTTSATSSEHSEQDADGEPDTRSHDSLPAPQKSTTASPRSRRSCSSSTRGAVKKPPRQRRRLIDLAPAPTCWRKCRGRRATSVARVLREIGVGRQLGGRDRIEIPVRLRRRSR